MSDYKLPDRLEVDLHISPAAVSLRDAETGTPVLRVWAMDLSWVAGELTTATLTYYDPDGKRRSDGEPEYTTREYVVSLIEGSRVVLFSEAPAVSEEQTLESA